MDDDINEIITLCNLHLKYQEYFLLYDIGDFLSLGVKETCGEKQDEYIFHKIIYEYNEGMWLGYMIFPFLNLLDYNTYLLGSLTI